MSQPQIQPHRVTKPIQLLAAWLAGLVLVNGSFLACAASIQTPSWVPGTLVVAAIVNVPLFLFALFLLQTRYRPEMQEDIYYSKYLETRQNRLTPEDVSVDVATLRSDVFASTKRSLELLEALRSQISRVASTKSAGGAVVTEGLRIEESLQGTDQAIQNAIAEADWDRYSVLLNQCLPSFDKIQQALISAGVSSLKKFGDYPPKFGVMSFGPGVSAQVIQQLYSLIEGMGLRYLAIADDDMHSGRIYIGSYRYKVGAPIALIDEELQKVLCDVELTTDRLKALVFEKAKPMNKG